MVFIFPAYFTLYNGVYLRNKHRVMCTMASEFVISITDVTDCVSASSIPFCLAVSEVSLCQCLTLIKELEIRPLLSAFDCFILCSQFSSFAQCSLWSHHVTDCYIMKVVAFYFFFPTYFLEN